MYRSSPHCTAGETPAKLFLGRELRTQLDLLKPDLHKKVTDSHENKASDTARTLNIGQKVWTRNYSNNGERWVFGTERSEYGFKHYVIETSHQIIRRHIDQIREGADEVKPVCELNTQPNADVTMTDKGDCPVSSSSQPDHSDVPPHIQDSNSISGNCSPPAPGGVVSSVPNTLRRSTRISKPPERLNL
ncbi:uncharacterized protein LOC124278881 [Haliotis rubra]|uniref:uncharacterized protein LOC124278881 n=1 Tax=Haliotis rubra TaxID=36100 RepID=UPI001EE53E09|nr:uncharacterized protein LOC124278881 [Haliotis rubra]